MDTVPSREKLARVLTAAGRALCLVLIVVLGLTGVSAAGAPVTPAAAAQGGDEPPGPLDPEEAGLPELEALIDAYDASVASLRQRTDALAGEQRAAEQKASALKAAKDSHNQKVSALQARIDAHNSAPHVFELPRQAGQKQAYDAEAAQLNAQKNQLNAEKSQGEAEQGALRAELSRLEAQSQSLKTTAQQLAAQGKQLRQRIEAARQARLKPRPPAARQAPGGDPVRQAPPNRGGARENGGDQASRSAKNAALDQYEKDNKTPVIREPVTAELSPKTRAGLPPKVAAKLTDPALDFDGAVLKPNGNYRVLDVSPVGRRLSSSERAFRNSIEQGGTADAVIGGRKVVVDEITPVPLGGRRAPQWTPSNDGMDPLRREVERAGKRFPKVSAAEDRTIGAAKYTGDDGTNANLRAVSGKDAYLDQKGVKIEGGSRLPDNPHYKTKEVNGVPRDVDAEAKILEDLNRRIPRDAKGKLTMVVDYPAGDKLPPDKVVCPSCQGVLKDFADEHPGVRVEVRDMNGRLLYLANND
ncbi:deaminase domain-containing protein [Amycolatopsis samaneae]|uniref:Deaminase domain-containing protein n=1 Tax=Amycolatopsis samaneae TaxID=664691 RepID=A0ABW5GGH8_9PSEU